mgnify:FL=1
MWGMSDAMIPRLVAGPRNEFHPPLAGGFDPEGRPSGLMYPTPDNLYTFGRYEVDDDQALIVTVTPVACRYWSFYLGSLFQQSLPYGEGYGLITREMADLESDGSVTFVISAEDPGRPNWLPTQSHRQGMMALRWLLPDVDEAPLPSCRLVALGELGA